MKKKIIPFFFFLFSISTWSQKTITSAIPCTDAMAQQAKGRWIPNYDLAPSVSLTQKQESYNRLEVLHNILLRMFPQPVGVDIRVNRSAAKGYYGSTRKYHYTPDDRLTFDYMKIFSILSYSYYANFSPHYCAHTDKGLVFMTGNQNENSDGIGISVNDFSGLVSGPSSDDGWTINGQPVRMLSTMINEKWKGYELYGDVRGPGRHILIHREGMLPYIPVTRKQYLERCIFFNAQLHDKIIEGARQMPVRSLEEQEKEKNARLTNFEKDFGKDPKRLKSAVDYYLSGYKTDQQIREENIANAKKQKEQELKKFTDELEKTTNEGLLDSPAVIRVMYYSDLIFDTDTKTGSMLITENPDYIRKELPAYMPQFIVLNWKWNVGFYPVHIRYEKLFLQDFPVEKLQALIDK